jgi:hypothetical protein
MFLLDESQYSQIYLPFLHYFDKFFYKGDYLLTTRWFNRVNCQWLHRISQG